MTLTRPIVPMWGAELGQLLAILHALQPRRVFEWGSGGSTVTLPRMCPYVQRWTAIEHDPAWHGKVDACPRPDSVQLRLFEVPYDGSRAKYAQSERLGGNPEWDAYVGAIDQERPDLVLVDGRARNRCMLQAAAHPTVGTVIVHDAQRSEYKQTLRMLGARWLQPYTGGAVAVIALRSGLARAR